LWLNHFALMQSAKQQILVIKDMKGAY
jgi:hypothetical protein